MEACAKASDGKDYRAEDTGQSDTWQRDGAVVGPPRRCELRCWLEGEDRLGSTAHTRPDSVCVAQCRCCSKGAPCKLTLVYVGAQFGNLFTF
jgi:hypothetical protein